MQTSKDASDMKDKVHIFFVKTAKTRGNPSERKAGEVAHVVPDTAKQHIAAGAAKLCKYRLHIDTPFEFYSTSYKAKEYVWLPPEEAWAVIEKGYASPAMQYDWHKDEMEAYADALDDLIVPLEQHGEDLTAEALRAIKSHILYAQPTSTVAKYVQMSVCLESPDLAIPKGDPPEADVGMAYARRVEYACDAALDAAAKLFGDCEKVGYKIREDIPAEEKMSWTYVSAINHALKRYIEANRRSRKPTELKTAMFEQVCKNCE